jgi:protein-S-isoprenylcysteine O-methyltransferase Ste14
MWKTVLLALLGGVAFMVLVGALLFGCAGRWDLPLFWAYLGVMMASAVIGPFVVDPTLFKERLRPGPGGKDYLIALVATPLWLGQFVLAGLSVGRFQWTSDAVPLAVQVIGLAAMTVALAVVLWAMAVNRFFSSVIRIQTDRGHHLITTGPYRYVRHPAYAVCIFLFVGGGLALGSWLAALLGLAMTAMIVRRTALEDRTLREQLEGYAAYAEKVRYRLLPGVW